MDLQLRNKVPKLRGDRTEATHSNHVWAMDFVHDQLATGRKIRVLTVVGTSVIPPPFGRQWQRVYLARA